MKKKDKRIVRLITDNRSPMEKLVEERMDDEQAVRRRNCSLEQQFLIL